MHRSWSGKWIYQNKKIINEFHPYFYSFEKIFTIRIHKSVNIFIYVTKTVILPKSRIHLVKDFLDILILVPYIFVDPHIKHEKFPTIWSLSEFIFSIFLLFSDTQLIFKYCWFVWTSFTNSTICWELEFTL